MTITKQKPSDICRLAGLNSLAELCRITGQSDQTITNWFKNKPKLFKVVLQGAVLEKAGGIKSLKSFT